MATKKVDKIKVTLIKGLIGCTEKQIRTAHSLGLKRRNAFNVVPKDAANLGKVNIISHLVAVEEE